MSRKGNPMTENFDRKSLKIGDREFLRLWIYNRKTQKLLKKGKGMMVHKITSSPVVVFENKARCPLGTTTKRKPWNPPTHIKSANELYLAQIYVTMNLHIKFHEATINSC